MCDGLTLRLQAQVPVVQKRLVALCHKYAKPCIVATQVRARAGNARRLELEEVVKRTFLSFL